MRRHLYWTGVVLAYAVVGHTFGAVNSLLPGDIAVIGLNTDATGTTDDFSFVTFVDIQAGQTFSFRDNGWSNVDNAFRANSSGSEGPVQTFTAGGLIKAGSIVNVNPGGLTITNDDELLIFETTTGNGNLGQGGINFVYGIDNNTWLTTPTAAASLGTTDSNLPNVLANPNTNNVGLNNRPANTEMLSADNGFYNVGTSVPSLLRGAYLTSISNMANWTTNNTTVQTLPSSGSLKLRDPRFNAEYRFTGAAGNEASGPAAFTPAYATAGAVTRGAGLGAAAAANVFNSNGFNSGLTLASAMAANDYLEFSLTPGQYAVTLLMIEMDLQRSATGPVNVALLSSVDGFLDPIGGVRTLASGANEDLEFFLTTVPGYADLHHVVTFRLFGWNASSTAGTLQLDNLEVYAFAYIPEPAGAAVLALGAAAMLRRRF